MNVCEGCSVEGPMTKTLQFVIRHSIFRILTYGSQASHFTVNLLLGMSCSLTQLRFIKVQKLKIKSKTHLL